MLKNKKLIILGSAMLAVPLIATVSCSTSWTSWNVDSDPNPEDNKIIYESKIAAPNLWQVREIDVIKTAAWNQTTSTIDLAQLNNQFELMDLMIDVLKLHPADPMDTYWDVDHYDEMKAYLSQITPNMTLKIKYQNQSSSITWNVATILTAAIKGIDDYLASPNEALKAFNIELPNGHGLNSEGQPVDFNDVATIGMPLTTNPVVAALLQKDNAFALALSKLVNLPKVTFDSFNSFLGEIDHVLSAVLKRDPRTRTGVFWQWSDAKGLDFSLSQNGLMHAYPTNYDSDKVDNFKGIFMLRALK